MKEDTFKYWSGVAKDKLLGRTITEVRYMSVEEMEDMGWYHRPVVIVLDNGNAIFPSADDEGNNAGALFTNDDLNPVLPVLRNLK